MSLPTVDDLKAHLDPGDSGDAELTDFLDAAVEAVEGIVGPVGLATVTETHYGVSSDVLVLRQMPVAALVSVSSRFGATTTALTLADYELNLAAGIVRQVSGSGFYGNYTITYSVGREVVPASIQLAILIIAEHLHETQRMPGQTSDRPAGFGGIDGVADAGFMPRGFAIPSRAQELLRPYIVPVVA